MIDSCSKFRGIMRGTREMRKYLLVAFLRVFNVRYFIDAIVWKNFEQSQAIENMQKERDIPERELLIRVT